MSFAMMPGITLEQMQRAMSQSVQMQNDELPAPKRARIRGKFKADDLATPQDEAWDTATSGSAET